MSVGLFAGFVAERRWIGCKKLLVFKHLYSAEQTDFFKKIISSRLGVAY